MKYRRIDAEKTTHTTAQQRSLVRIFQDFSCDIHASREQRQWCCRLDGDPAAVITAPDSDRDRAWPAGTPTWWRTPSWSPATAPPVTFTVTVRTEPEPTVILDVADVSPALSVQDLPGEVGHFGLWIAEELARVTIHPTTTGKTVRAEFVLFAPPPPGAPNTAVAAVPAGGTATPSSGHGDIPSS